jgi:translation initiation factor 1 (eIF-1/SUI1)
MGAQLDKFKSATGTLTDAAKVAAPTVGPTSLADAAKEAEQIATAQKVAPPTERTITEAEKVEGSAVDTAKVATELAKAEAATGTVTEDMTVQGQLAKLTKNFDATNPPSWASGALRAVTAEMSAKGIHTSNR